MSQDTNPLALPDQIHHIGVVVKDIEETIKFLSTIWGLTPWEVFDYHATPDKMISGEPFDMKVAFAKLGPTQMELLEPLDTHSMWACFLQTRGEGIHHLSYDAPNYDAMVAKLKEQGCPMLVSAYNDDGTRWCYFETKPGGIIIEFEEP